MHILVSGLSHKTAPVEVREALALQPHEFGDALSTLLGYPTISESVIVSTCNRTEVYAVSTDIDEGRLHINKFLQGCDGATCDLTPYLYHHDSVSAVRHLFRVASSLDSMIVGEAQILGQLKESYAHAFDGNATNIVLNKLFRQAFAVGKRVRTETDIGENAVSISYAAVQLAKKVFSDLTGRTVMIIGAGKMSELTAKHLLANGVKDVLIANRSQHRAVQMAKLFNGRTVDWDDRVSAMAGADIVISSTGAPHYVLKKEDMVQVLSRRRGRPLFLIDIAVPRDIDPAVNDIDNAYLYNIDDLQAVVDSNLAERSREAKEAEKIIHVELQEFLSWLGTLEVVPTIAELRQTAERIRDGEIEKALAKLGHLSERDRNVIGALASGIVNKLLHKPVIRMKESARSKEGYLYAESLRHLFGLGEDEPQEQEAEEGKLAEIKDGKHQFGAS